jgi:polyisoprenoid-binding protein YceI
MPNTRKGIISWQFLLYLLKPQKGLYMSGILRVYRRFNSILLILISGSFICTTAGEYQVDKSNKNLVKFISDAPIEDVEGITDKIDGYLTWDGQDSTQQSELYFEVDLNSLDTGIGLRNRHMRENYLETDKFPYTHYKGKIASSKKLDDSTYAVVTEGSMFIHGIEKPLSVQGTLVKKSDDQFRIKTNFQVKLSDFEIKIPSIMFYKINEIMELVLDFCVRKA